MIKIKRTQKVKSRMQKTTLVRDLFIKPRYDVMLIWGHGYTNVHNILDIIQNEDFFDVVYVDTKIFSNIRSFVKRVYSFDYAPVHHLKGKIRYLMNTEPKVTLLLLKNKIPDEDLQGNGMFRHVESRSLVKLKNKIREAFNPRDGNGLLTHDHVVHTTDNESQTDKLLRLFGHRAGISKFTEVSDIINLPHYIQNSDFYELIKVDFDNIRCVNFEGQASLAKRKIMKIEETAQYIGLNNIEHYNRYVTKYLGYELKKYYNADAYWNMFRTFQYLDGVYHSDYVICRRTQDDMYLLIIDGLHRAAMHKFQGNTDILLMVIK